MLVSSTHKQGRQVKNDARHARLRSCSNLCLILFYVACEARLVTQTPLSSAASLYMLSCSLPA